MAADGTISNTGSGSSGGPTGNENLTDQDDEVKKLFDISSTPLTSVGGTGDAITASFSPTEATITTGRKFSFVAAANNTGATTINLNSAGAVDLVDDDGDALGPDQIVSGRLHEIEFDGTKYRLRHSSTISVVRNIQTFNSSGTWNKPSNVDGDALVIVEAWGGGGGGAPLGAGGGGGYVTKRFKASDLGSTETVTIGAGGANGSPTGTAGGATTFGAHVTAYGGGAGAGTISGGGGAGGSITGPGGNGTTGGAGGLPADNGAGEGEPETTGFLSSAYWGGGGGASSGVTAGANSGFGGGGGGVGAGAGGTSVFGGDGGAGGANGTQPGGGGGSNASGADGRIVVHVIG